jgi:hypothetical protein
MIGYNKMKKTMEKKMPEEIKKELISLFKDIKYQTGYMSGSWGNSKMLSQMAREDGISPWSIESEIDNFAKKHKLKV